MGLTLYAAVKAYLEAQSLAISVYRDAPPENASKPYVVFTAGISLTLDPLEDGGATTGTEEIQLDLYEVWRAGDDKSGESPTLADAITSKLQGTPLMFGQANKRAYGMLERSRMRRVDRDERVVRHTYQVDVVRQI